MPQWAWKHYPEGTTSDEFQAILSLRRSTDQAAAENPDVAYPKRLEDRWGYRTSWRSIGRDSDGSLRLVVVIQGPRGEIVYRRQYRLVRRERLPWELGRG
jgi:hypothetical protein